MPLISGVPHQAVGVERVPSAGCASANAKAEVLDFGIAHMTDTQLTGRGVRIGTPGYSAPEQVAASAVGLAANQWSLAATFYALLTDTRPGSTKEEEQRDPRAAAVCAEDRIVDDEVVRLGERPHLVDVPVSVVAAIERAMSHRSEDRFESVTAFVAAMQEGVSSPAEPVFGAANTEVELHKWAGGGKTTVIQLGQSHKASDSDPTPLLLETPRSAAIAEVSTENISRKPRRRGWQIVAMVGILAAAAAVAVYNSDNTNEQTAAIEPAPAQRDTEKKPPTIQPVFVPAMGRPIDAAVAPSPATVAAMLDGRPIEDLVATINGKNVVLPYLGVFEGRVAVEVGIVIAGICSRPESHRNNTGA